MSKPIPIAGARCYDLEGRSVLELQVDGVAWGLFEQKATLLAAGLVALPDELASYGDVYDLPGLTETAEPAPVINCTGDPVVLELARRLWVGEIQPGELVEIPTIEEAQAARWDIEPLAGIFRRKIQR